jgi:phage terminase large subunit
LRLSGGNKPPQISGSFVTQKTAATDCNKLIIRRLKNRHKFSFLTVVLTFLAAFDRRKGHKFL